MHCKGIHSLQECSEIMDERLGELLVQLGGGKSGQTIFQDEDAKLQSTLFCRFKMSNNRGATMNLADYSNTLIAYAATNKAVRFERGEMMKETCYWLDHGAVAEIIRVGGCQMNCGGNGGGGCTKQCRILMPTAVMLKCIRIPRPTAVMLKCVSCTMARPCRISG